jgi:hypothetical protein
MPRSPVKVNQYFEGTYGLKMEAVFSSEESVDFHRTGRGSASQKTELFPALFSVPVFMCQITIKGAKQLDCGHQANTPTVFIRLAYSTGAMISGHNTKWVIFTVYTYHVTLLKTSGAICLLK